MEGSQDEKISPVSEKETELAVASILPDDLQSGITPATASSQDVEMATEAELERPKTPSLLVSGISQEFSGGLQEASMMPLPVTPKRVSFPLTKSGDPVMTQAGPSSPMSTSSLLYPMSGSKPEMQVRGATPTITSNLSEVINLGSKESLLPDDPIDKEQTVQDFLSSSEAHSAAEDMEADSPNVTESNLPSNEGEMTQEQEDDLLRDPEAEEEKSVELVERMEDEEKGADSEQVQVVREIGTLQVVEIAQEQKVESEAMETNNTVPLKVEIESKDHEVSQTLPGEPMILSPGKVSAGFQTLSLGRSSQSEVMSPSSEKSTVEVTENVQRTSEKSLETGPTMYKLSPKPSISQADREQYKTPSELAKEREKATESIPVGEFDSMEHCKEYFKAILDLEQELPIEGDGLNLQGLILMLVRHNLRLEMKMESGFIHPQSIDDIVLFSSKLSPLSNWHKIDVQQGSETWSCVEQGMMYGKAILFGDHKRQIQIKLASNPRKIQELGRKVKDFDQEKWDRHKIQLVYDLNWSKFSQNTDYKTYLITTYPKYLAEVGDSDIWTIGRYYPPTVDSFFTEGLGLIKGVNRPQKISSERIAGTKYYLPPHSNLNQFHPLPEIRKMYYYSMNRPCMASRQRVFNEMKCFRDGLPPDPMLPENLSAVALRMYIDASASISVTEIPNVLIFPNGDEVLLCNRESVNPKVLELKDEVARYKRFCDFVPVTGKMDPEDPDPLEGYRVICINSPEEYCNRELYQDYEIREDYNNYPYDPAHEYRAAAKPDHTPTHYTESHINNYTKPDKVRVGVELYDFAPNDPVQRNKIIQAAKDFATNAVLTEAQREHREKEKQRGTGPAEIADAARKALNVQRGQHNNRRKGRCKAVDSGLVARGDLQHLEPEQFNEDDFDSRSDLMTTYNIVLKDEDMQYSRKITNRVMEDFSMGQQLALGRVFLEEMEHIPDSRDVVHLLGFGGEIKYNKRTMQHMRIYEKGFKCPFAEARYHDVPKEACVGGIENGRIIGCHSPVQYFEDPLEYQVHFKMYHSRNVIGRGHCQYLVRVNKVCNYEAEKAGDLMDHVLNKHKGEGAKKPLISEEDGVYYINLPSLPDHLKTYPEVLYGPKNNKKIVIQLWINLQPYEQDPRSNKYRVPVKDSIEWRVCKEHGFNTLHEAKKYIEGLTSPMKRSISNESLASSTRSHSKSRKPKGSETPATKSKISGQRKRVRSYTPSESSLPTKRRSESPESVSRQAEEHHEMEPPQMERSSRPRERVTHNPVTEREQSVGASLRLNQYDDVPVPFGAPFWEWRMYCYKMSKRIGKPQRVIASIVINHWNGAKNRCYSQASISNIEEHMMAQVEAYERDIDTLNTLYDINRYRSELAIKEMRNREAQISQSSYIKYYKSRMDAEYDFIFPHLNESIENLKLLREVFLEEYPRLAKEIVTLLRDEQSLEQMRKILQNFVKSEQERLRVYRFKYDRIEQCRWPEWTREMVDGTFVSERGYLYKETPYDIPRIYKSMSDEMPIGWRTKMTIPLTDEEKYLLTPESPEYVCYLKRQGRLESVQFPSEMVDAGSDLFGPDEFGPNVAMCQYRPAVFQTMARWDHEERVKMATENLQRDSLPPDPVHDVMDDQQPYYHPEPQEEEQTQQSWTTPSDSREYSVMDTSGGTQHWSTVGEVWEESSGNQQRLAVSQHFSQQQDKPFTVQTVGQILEEIREDKKQKPGPRPFGVEESQWTDMVAANVVNDIRGKGQPHQGEPKTAKMVEAVGLPLLENETEPGRPLQARGKDITADIPCMRKESPDIRSISEDVNLVNVMESFGQHCTPLAVRDQQVSEERKEQYKKGTSNVGPQQTLESLLQKGDCVNVPVDNDQRAGRAQLAITTYQELNTDEIALKNAYAIIGAVDTVKIALYATTRRLQLESARVDYLETKFEEGESKITQAENVNHELEKSNEKIRELEHEIAVMENRVQPVVQERDQLKHQLDETKVKLGEYKICYDNLKREKQKYTEANTKAEKVHRSLEKRISELEKENSQLKVELARKSQTASPMEIVETTASSLTAGGDGVDKQSPEMRVETVMDKLEVIDSWSAEFKSQVISHLGAIQPEKVSNPNPEQKIKKFSTLPTCVISMTPTKIFMDPLPTNESQLQDWKENMEDRVIMWSMKAIQDARKQFSEKK